MDFDDPYTFALSLIDWLPDTLWDSILAMLALYGAVLYGVVEVHLWFDRRAL